MQCNIAQISEQSDGDPDYRYSAHLKLGEETACDGFHCRWSQKISPKP